MEIREFAFQPAHFTEGQGLELRPLIRCSGFRTRQVCASCNNGWMSRLEVWAKSKIGAAVAPHFRLESMFSLALQNGEMDSLIRWLLKTAVIFELASPRGNIPAVNPELFPIAAGNELPTDFYVRAGYILDRNFLVHLRRGFPVWNAGALQPYQIHRASMDFALQLNHLAIRLIRCPDATPGVKLAHVITDGSSVMRSVPFVLRLRSVGTFPTLISFETFLLSSTLWRCILRLRKSPMNYWEIIADNLSKAG
jgi:hypothetical protein